MLGGAGLGTLESSFSANELRPNVSGIRFDHYPSKSDMERDYAFCGAQSFYRPQEAYRPISPKYQRKVAPPYNPNVARWCPEYDVPPLLYDDPRNATAPSLAFLEISAK